MDVNYDDVSLQLSEDREFKNQFRVFTKEYSYRRTYKKRETKEKNESKKINI